MPKPLSVAPGALFYSGYLSVAEQEEILAQIRAVISDAPLFTPTMPRTAKPFSVGMTNCGTLGWVSDREGYRYQPQHPVTGLPWPAIPAVVSDIWRDLAPDAPAPEACLVNVYKPSAKMGLHQDRDEQDFDAPVLSISLGDSAMFRIGGTTRNVPTKSIRLHSGDVFVLGGESRLSFHGVDRIYANTSTLLRPETGRINLTLRRVSPA